MCSSSFEDDPASFNPVNQKPVRFNMAFPTIFEIANQEMIPVFAFQRYFVNEFTNDGLDKRLFFQNERESSLFASSV